MTRQWAYDDIVIVADDLVLEIFHGGYDRSFRIPLAWLAVRTKEKRHDEVELLFGRVVTPGQAMYGPDLDVQNYSILFRLPAAAELQLRDFIAQCVRP